MPFTSMEMHNVLENIRVIGFDLDQTLYPKSSVIDEKIQSYLYQKIAEHAHVDSTAAEALFKDRYRSGSGMSGSETLADLGFANPSDIVQEALEHADIASVLFPNPETNTFLARIRERYEGMDLVTGSNLDQTIKKLTALEISPDNFSHIITADDSSKSSGASYEKWLSLYPILKPNEFLYIGDRSRTDHDVPSALGIRTCLVYVSELNPALSALQFPTLTEFFTTLFSNTG